MYNEKMQHLEKDSWLIFYWLFWQIKGVSTDKNGGREGKIMT